jgi:hypothetical protein
MGALSDVLNVSAAKSKVLWGKAFPQYRGRRVKVLARTQVGLYGLNWDEGNKSEYVILRSDGKQADMRFASSFAPWSNPWEGRIVELSAEIVVIERWRSGSDQGINIYAHPSVLPKLLPGGGGA